jgi:hypothetical protein
MMVLLISLLTPRSGKQRGESLQVVAAALGNTPGVVESNYGHLRTDATKRVVDGGNN